MSVALVAILKRSIHTPIGGEPPYITTEASEVFRFHDPKTTVLEALAQVYAKYPDAISVEAYVPKTCPLSQPRH